ncbi:hypothetical protein F442_18776 [Phytophthora nicotianae P10297]|uniref:Uncharacterized protein n=1 Tax=Phytophthora nicotianae P10297 TaxID=1317064 RepID=W2YBU6_PHYNI|nr:hypothetical protein F442_18776 [Phytophthora nicotianae P10297]
MISAGTSFLSVIAALLSTNSMVNDLPDQNLTMVAATKYQLFLDILRVIDTCFTANRGLPLPKKLMLNRYFSIMYQRAKEVFMFNQFADLDAQIKTDHGDIASH